MDSKTVRLSLCVMSIIFSFALVSGQGNETLIVSTIISEPHLMLQKTPDGNDTYTGYIKELMDRIASKLGIQYQFAPVEDNVYGAKLENGTWTGMIGVLINDNAHLAAASLTITQNRAKEVDFSIPFQTFGPVILMRKPTEEQVPLKDRLTKLLTPFEFSVWLISVVAFMVTSTIIYIISYFNPYEWRRMSHDGEATLRERESFTCLNSFWFAISAWAWQGYTRSPRSMGGRIVVTFWWLFVVIFLSCYIASLTNLLRAGPKHKEMQKYSPIQSLSDLSKQSKVKPLVMKDGSTESFLKQSQTPYLKDIYERIRSDSSLAVSSYHEGLQKVKMAGEDESYAFIAESQFARYATRDCSVYVVNDFIIYRYYGLAFPKSSTIKDMFSLAILELQENGFLNELEERWFKSECDNSMMISPKDARIGITQFYQLDMGSFSGALFILAVGLIFGGLVTVVEILLYKFAESEPEPEPVMSAGNAKEGPEVTDTLLHPDDDAIVDKSGTTV